jgi:hypothetical protein
MSYVASPTLRVAFASKLLVAGMSQKLLVSDAVLLTLGARGAPRRYVPEPDSAKPIVALLRRS